MWLLTHSIKCFDDDDDDDHDQNNDSLDDNPSMVSFTGDTWAIFLPRVPLNLLDHLKMYIYNIFLTKKIPKWIPAFLFRFLFPSYRNSYHNLCLDTV